MKFGIHLLVVVTTVYICLNFVSMDTCCSCQSCEEYLSDNITTSTEKQLTRILMKSYQVIGKGGRPVKDTETSTRVRLMFGLIDLNLDERDKMLTTSMWVFLKWRDEYLVWEPEQYKGLQVTRLDSHEIWTPDIMLYNTAEPESKHRNSLVKVRYDGSIQWNRHQIFKSSCALNVSDFPFDTQICNLWFGSWTHNEREINLNFSHPMGIDLQIFREDYGISNEWNITQLVPVRIMQHGTPILTYELHLQRKMVFSSYILTLPCIFLATLTLVVFCLPPERPDRTGLGMSLFSSFLVLLLILVEAAPSSASSVPKLGIYYCFNMVIIMLSIFLSSIVVNIHRAGRSLKRLPYIVRLIFLHILGRICLVKPCGIQKKILLHFRGHAVDRKRGVDENFSLLTYSGDTDGISNSTSDNYSKSPSTNHIQASQSVEYLLQENITKVSELKEFVKRLLDYINKKERNSKERLETAKEWQQLAKVVDRLLFVLYVFAIVISLIYQFPRPPFLEKWQYWS